LANGSLGSNMDIAATINKYGFPIVAAGGLSYIIYYIWRWATMEIKPILSEANGVLIALIDRIRMLDNDLIRLNQKLNIVLQLRGKEIESERHLHDVKTTAEAQKRELEAASQQKKAAEELAHGKVPRTRKKRTPIKDQDSDSKEAASGSS